ncbi:hypothetical protein LIW29_000182 [Campylobacter jejuni]|nr:hypothetical protein [Campylobacter jejuni]EDP5448270.1 hypothetical protein [Campylobacter jejuni]EIJ3186204.1 hypothetical protein [Campylobacter jejuni]
MNNKVDLNELQVLTETWHKDRKITINGTSLAQLCKLSEEQGELASAINRGCKDKEAIKDAIGDCIVVLSAIANLNGMHISDCWKHAYNIIKDRKGILTKEGVFIKEEDLK